MLTLVDVCDRLSRVDEISVLEILEINSTDLVEAFKDKIEDNYDELAEELADDEYERE